MENTRGMSKRWGAFTQIDILFLLLFFISWAHSVLGVLFYASLLYYCRYGAEGGVKALFLLTARGILSSAVAAPIGMTMIRWCILFGMAIWTIVYSRPTLVDRTKCVRVIVAGALYPAFAIFASFASGSYPVTSAFKAISYFVPFCAILLGVASTYRKCNWLNYYFVIFLILFGISLLLLPFNQFRVVNDAFQGVFNQVNMFGILSALFIAVVLYAECISKSPARMVILILVLVMGFQSASRTGMITALTTILCCLVFGFICRDSSKRLTAKKTTVFIVGMLFLFLMLFLILQENQLMAIQDAIVDFLWKGGQDSIYSSRMDAIMNMQEKYANNKWIGSGFMAPFVKDYVNYALSFDLFVEPGNILLTLLGDTGIVGTVLFFAFLIVIICSGSIQRIPLLVAGFMINMGEMVFFSSNNMAMLIYLLLAVYVFGS